MRREVVLDFVGDQVTCDDVEHALRAAVEHVLAGNAAEPPVLQPLDQRVPVVVSRLVARSGREDVGPEGGRHGLA